MISTAYQAITKTIVDLSSKGFYFQWVKCNA